MESSPRHHAASPFATSRRVARRLELLRRARSTARPTMRCLRTPGPSVSGACSAIAAPCRVVRCRSGSRAKQARRARVAPRARRRRRSAPLPRLPRLRARGPALVAVLRPRSAWRSPVVGVAGPARLVAVAAPRREPVAAVAVVAARREPVAVVAAEAARSAAAVVARREPGAARRQLLRIPALRSEPGQLRPCPRRGPRARRAVSRPAARWRAEGRRAPALRQPEWRRVEQCPTGWRWPRRRRPVLPRPPQAGARPQRRPPAQPWAPGPRPA